MNDELAVYSPGIVQWFVRWPPALVVRFRDETAVLVPNNAAPHMHAAAVATAPHAGSTWP